MKLDKREAKNGIVSVTVENPDDLWALYCVLEQNDSVRMRTLRKIKVESSDRAKSATKRPMTLTIKVEKISFDGAANAVKILGSVTSGPDDVPLGSHHSFTVQEFDELSIQKQWQQYQLKKLDAAVQSSVPHVLLVVCDRENATFAQMKSNGYAVIAQVKANVSKKREGADTGKEDIFGKIKQKISELSAVHDFVSVIIGCPGFWHPQIKQNVASHFPKITFGVTTVSTSDSAGIDEMLKRPETLSLLSQQRTLQEIQMVEDFLAHMAKDKPYAYGIDDCLHAAKQGAISVLLVSEKLMLEKREQNDVDRLEQVMRAVDGSRGEVHLISPDHEGGKKLDGLTGVVAMLRFAI